MKRGPKPSIAGSAPTPTRGVPTCPKHLDPVARTHWKVITKALDDLGVLSLSDADVLEIYCTVYSRWREAEAKVKAEGMTIEVGDKGYEIQNPYLNIANGCIKQMNSLMGNMGLTPAARAKVNAATKESADAEAFKDLIG